MGEQERYQVRFDWGVAGAHAVAADADVVVWVDALRAPGPGGGPPVGPDLAALPTGPAVVEASLPSAAAVARWVLDRQEAVRRRFGIAVIAAGATRADGGPRFAVEDLLAAGAVVDALAALGLDATSPEAAAAEAAYRGLRRAVGHLLTACVSATEAGAVPAGGTRGAEPGPADLVVHRDVRGAAR